MASKFADFIQKQGVDARRILVASRQIERLRPEDRKIRLDQRKRKSGDSPAPAAEAGEKTERRSGRPVTPRLLEQALAGKPISGPAKTRLLRALNRVLEQKKKDPADLRALF